MKNSKNYILIIFMGCVMLFVFVGCVIDSTVTYTVSGNIEFYDTEGSITNPIIIGTVKLFQPTLFCDSLSTLQNKYPVGATIDPILLMDHRLAGNPLAISTINSNGDFILTELLDGKYLLVYSVEGYGWHKQVCNVASDMSLHLKMRETIVCDENFNTIDGAVVWGPDQHVIITEDFSITNGASLTILENTVTEFDYCKFDVVGNFIVDGSDGFPVIFTSVEESPTENNWVGVWNSSENCVIANCIIEWALSGIYNLGKANLNQLVIQNCRSDGVVLDQNVATINNSTIIGCENGISAYETNAEETESIISNTLIFKNNSKGLELTHSSPLLNNCVFYENDVHINIVYSFPRIEHCAFGNSIAYTIKSQREYGINGEINIFYCDFAEDNTLIYCRRSADIIANYNNFRCSNGNVFELYYYYGGNNILAQNNWWGTSSETEIQNLIWDESDEPGGYDAGTVDYSSWEYHEIEDAGPQ
jgi:hypothetical protein